MNETTKASSSTTLRRARVELSAARRPMRRVLRALDAPAAGKDGAA